MLARAFVAVMGRRTLRVSVDGPVVIGPRWTRLEREYRPLPAQKKRLKTVQPRWNRPIGIRVRSNPLEALRPQAPCNRGDETTIDGLQRHHQLPCINGHRAARILLPNAASTTGSASLAPDKNQGNAKLWT